MHFADLLKNHLHSAGLYSAANYLQNHHESPTTNCLAVQGLHLIKGRMYGGNPRNQATCAQFAREHKYNSRSDSNDTQSLLPLDTSLPPLKFCLAFPIQERQAAKILTIIVSQDNLPCNASFERLRVANIAAKSLRHLHQGCLQACKTCACMQAHASLVCLEAVRISTP